MDANEAKAVSERTIANRFRAAEKAYSDHWPSYIDAKMAYRRGEIGDDDYLIVREEHERLLADWDEAFGALKTARPHNH